MGHWIQVFGYGLAALAGLTSAGMILLPDRWQRVEAWAYGGARRPMAVWGLALLLLILWGVALSQYLLAPADARSWAGWALLIGVPALWALKAVALVFNPAGRAAVSGIASAAVWRRVGIARLPIPFILIALTALA